MDNTLNYNGIIFDDFVVEENKWSQICKECSIKYNLTDKVDTLPVPVEIICGVEGCNNKADYYIDFK